MEKLKVLHVVPWLGRGGAERLVVDTCNELSMRDMEVTILNFRKEIDYNYLSAKVKRVVIPARFIPSVKGKPVSELNEYRDFVLTLKPHIIHSHLFASEMVTRQVIIKETSYVTHLHDNMPQFRNFSASTLFNKSRLAEYYEKKLMIRQYRKCRNNFLAISRHTAEYFNRSLPDDLRNRITVLNNAINFSRFSNTQKKILTEPYRLVTTGNLVDKKNHTFLVEVVKVLIDKGLKIHLDILGGEGPNRPKIQQKIDALGLNGCVTMQGNVERVEDYLRESQMYVHAATYEPFGLAIIEAMAAGLPCVMLDGKGNREIAEDGKNGFLVMENNPFVFAEKIERIIRSPGLYDSLSDYAVSFAKKFDIQQYATKLLSYYQAIRK